MRLCPICAKGCRCLLLTGVTIILYLSIIAQCVVVILWKLGALS